jgi:hypothetical protein
MAWGQIFTAVLGGIASRSKSKSDAKAAERDIKGEGLEQRKSLAFTDDREYFRNMQLRKERSGALSSNYNQFSTVRDFAPNFQPGTGLDAMPTLKRPEDY